jgi:hypothetical protein
VPTPGDNWQHRCFVLRFERSLLVYRPGSSPGTLGATFDADGTFELGMADQSITFNLENGELFTYAWSLFEDTLSFKKISVGPTALVVKPLTRSSE